MRRHEPRMKRTLSIGRDRRNDIVLQHDSVSSRHARLHQDGARCWIEDVGSTNGTFVDDDPERVGIADVRLDSVVRFGSLRQTVRDLLGAPPPTTAPRTVAMADTVSERVFGRDATCDVPLDDPTVSRRHAALRQRGGELFVADLGSQNGTFVNGERIRIETALHEGDVLSIGAHDFRIGDGGLLGAPVAATEQTSGVRIEVREVAVQAGSKPLIAGVSFTLHPGEIAGLMGPSGSGKTTLMSAMNGYVLPAAGTVTFNGLDLHQHYDRFRLQLGYVPQDDIMHGELTVYQALYFTARLRLPADTSEADIGARVTAVLDRLGLGGTEDVLIGSPDQKGISGGQRKRVNIAMELLTDPAVLFLDEPTSGLSSQDALMVMKVLRSIADGGKTVLMTIHQPSLEVFRMMDHLVVLAKDAGAAAPGRLAWFGPAFPAAVRWFQPDLADDRLTPEGVLEGLTRASAAEWGDRYRASPWHQQFVVGWQASLPPEAGRHAQRPERGSFWRQTLALTRRLCLLKLADKRSLFTLAVQPSVIAGLLVLLLGTVLRQTPTDAAGGANFEAKLGIAQFLTLVSALWFGCNNSAREIVGERAIYRRERMVNLRIDSYLLAKFSMLGLLCLLQCQLMLLILFPGCGLAAGELETLALLWLTALVGVGLGLGVSATARTSEAAITLIPLLLLPMIMLGGLLFPVADLPNAAARWLAAMMPSRWAFEGLLVTEGAARATTLGRDPSLGYFPLDHRTGYGTVAGVLGGMTLLLLGLAAHTLRRRDIR